MVSEEASENKKSLYPTKPARQPNQIVDRKLPGGSAAARNGEKQIEYPTNKELFHEPDKTLPYNKASYDDEDFDDEDDDEDEDFDEDDDKDFDEDDEDHNSLPHDENGKQNLGPSIQSSKKCSNIITKERKRTSSHIEKASYDDEDDDEDFDEDDDEDEDFDEDDDEDFVEDDEDHNSLPHDENGKQNFGPSIQSSKKCSNIITEERKKTSSHIEKENKKSGVSFSSSHVIDIRDTHQTLDHSQISRKELHKNASTCKAFIQYCSTEIICPHEHRAALAVKLYGVQAALLSTLGNPFDMLSHSINSSNNSQIVHLNLGSASTRFLPAIVWTGMFILSFIYTVIVVLSLPFRVPIVSMLCLAMLYSLTILVSTASGFNIICGTFRMHGVLFASLGVLGFVMLLLVVVLLVLFTSWRCTKRETGVKWSDCQGIDVSHV